MKSRFIFVVSIVATAIVLLVAWHKDPLCDRVPTPGMAVYFAIFGFAMASLLIFSANVILALVRGKKAKSEEELETIVVPAMRGRECDDRILKWTMIPRAVVFGVSLGALCAAGIHHFVK
jgi:ABC-type dipeptide/oligopeptide/nickel transport system permease component